MNTSNDNQSRKDPVLEDFQQVHHEKNAFVVGDRVYMWKNVKGKPIKVWRTVKSIDSVEGKLYLEDSKRGVTIYGPNEKKHDNIITTDAWEKAFALLDEGWNNTEARENRINSVISCETVEGVPCIVISNTSGNVQTRWYIRRDWWSQLKKESTSQKHLSEWYIKPGATEPVKINPAKSAGDWIPLDVNWFVLKKNGLFWGWKPTKRSKIAEVCPWLKEMNAKWKSDSRPDAKICNIYELANRKK